MRVLLYGRFFDYEIQLAGAMSALCDVTLVMPANSIPEEFQNISEERFDFHLITNKNPRYIPIRLWNIIQTLKIMRRNQPEIVHLQLGGAIEHLAILVYIRLIKRRPLIVTFHDVKLHVGEESWKQDLCRYFLRKYCTKIIVHGDRLKEQMLKEYHIVPGKVFSIPIGEHRVSPFLRYKKEDIDEDENQVLFFGRIFHYKGLEYLIKAEPLINKQFPKSKIYIAGTGENFEKYEKMMGDRKNKFIINNKHISFEEGAKIFQQSSIVALPYIDASQSAVVLTAYGFCKPVVVTDVGSIPEIVDDNITGLIVPPGDHQKLAEAIIKLLKDKDLRKTMGENGFKKLKSDLSFEKIALSTFSIYQNTLKGKVRT